MIDDKKQANEVSIKEYLETRGLTFERKTGRYFCSSPFSSDRNYSFVVYPNNTYFDWSNGFGGDMIDLVMKIEKCNMPEAIKHLVADEYEKIKFNYKKYKYDKKIYKSFNINKYINNNKREIKEIKEYAENRGISSGYLPGVFFTKEKGNNKWIRFPSIMYPHLDEDLIVCGAKFRIIHDQPKQKMKDGHDGRFSARGKMSMYILENITDDEPVLYVVESESSANSLWSYLVIRGKSGIVISFGSVGSIIKKLPKKYENIITRKLIIDYDGSEELFNKRIKVYDYLEADVIKLELPKGEDINSLWVSNKINFLNKLI